MARWRASVIPAKPRPSDTRRERDADGRRDLVREPPARALVRGRPARDFVREPPARDLVREPPARDLVSPFSRRILLTVRAATSSARPPYRPDLLALSLMCLYCRSRFGLAPRGIFILPSCVVV